MVHEPPMAQHLRDAPRPVARLTHQLPYAYPTSTPTRFELPAERSPDARPRRFREKRRMQGDTLRRISRPGPERILLALQRFAGHADLPTRADLNLLIVEATWVGYLTLRRSRNGLASYLDLSDLGFGMDAIAEAFRGTPECPKLREIAAKVTGQTDGNAEAASLYFRRIMAKYAQNHAKSIFEEIRKYEGHLRRVIAKAIPRDMQHGDRMYFLPARSAWQPTLPSDIHIEELRLRCGAGEGRAPRLVAATRAILDENRQVAPWVSIKQLVDDYLHMITMGKRLPDPESPVGPNGFPEDDLHAALERDRMLKFLQEVGFATLRKAFLSRTSLPREAAEKLWDAFQEYQVARFRCEASPDERFDHLIKRMPELTRAQFRATYRPTMDRLQAELHALLPEPGGSDGPSGDLEGGDEA